ncbi:hypothetical protein B0H10DRAFT_1945544 [Mycena sp. CBHHK59/15]|nr:hypothetical protein B0H10DRAFT_1945544 [Mycena sp. CBHHK59/15]
MSRQIFNVEEAAHPSEFQTSAAQAQAEAPTSAIAREVEANAERVQDVAQNTAFEAQAKGPALTGNSATEQLQQQAAQKTSAAVDQGQRDVAAAKATGAGYVEQAKSLASSAVTTAQFRQSYLPPGSGPNGERTTGDVVAGLQAGANAALATTKEYLAAAQETAQPHLNKAKDVATSYLPGSTTTTRTAPVSSSKVLQDFIVNIAQQFAGHDHQHTVAKASQENPDDAEYYEQASKHVATHTDQHRPPSDDEREQVQQAHSRIYGQGESNVKAMGVDAVGGAAAAEAIQKFLSGGGGDQKDLIAFAMTEASKLMGGETDSGFKGQVIQKAAMMALKSQLSGGSGGGAMSLLSKFM